MGGRHHEALAERLLAGSLSSLSSGLPYEGRLSSTSKRHVDEKPAVGWIPRSVDEELASRTVCPPLIVVVVASVLFPRGVGGMFLVGHLCFLPVVHVTQLLFASPP